MLMHEYHQRREALEEQGFGVDPETANVSSVYFGNIENVARLYFSGDIFLPVRREIEVIRLQHIIRRLFCNDPKRSSLDGKRWVWAVNINEPVLLP